MAALCNIARSFTKRLLLGDCARQVWSQQSGNQIQRSLTWSQLKSFCSQAAADRQSTRPGQKWLMLIAGAGFTQAFLGFNFGKKGDEKKERDPLLHVYQEAKEAHMQRDFNKAEIRYHDALRVADEMLKLKKINRKTYIYACTNIFDSLADMALGLGQLEKAEGLYKETMKGCLQQGLPQDDNSIIELSIKLASIYAMMDKRQEAEEGLLFCIHAQDGKLDKSKTVAGQVHVPEMLKKMVVASEEEGKEPGNANVSNNSDSSNVEVNAEELSKDTEALLGMALETYGRFLMGHRRLSESIPIFERALDVARKVLGSEHEQYFILMNDLATAHILLRQYDKATAILNSAIDSGTKVHSSHLPVLYCNLGAIFLRLSKLSEAEVSCKKGKELSQGGKNMPGFSMAQRCLEKVEEVRKKAKA